ncbi:TPA: hypothetical protein N0F65_005933 [Lagenidium giganteum]|uniref:1-phosphatidylinositol 4-kinase n=1 Tax=Lagenidium giganteum TaxID=4803 RepID=A0AAV2Z6D1_9STRA|nr:TPA: hypothetical protein N0F65_005933 [Lagenidium giganteum]
MLAHPTSTDAASHEAPSVSVMTPPPPSPAAVPEAAYRASSAPVTPISSSALKQAHAQASPTPSTAHLTVEELFSDDKVDMRLLMMALWQRRKDEKFTAALCERLSYLSISKPTLDQLEFYLPQLAHMVIHLEKELPIEAMEQFVLLLSQSSAHFALQLFWIIYAALDENRPKRNGNAKTFARCAQLLLALEQCFVYGSPVARKASELLTRQSISKAEMEQILMADRRFFAAQSALENKDQAQDVAEGWLFKKGGGTRKIGRRNWNLRWCRIERRMLLIFTNPGDAQARSGVPLDRAEVRVVDNPKHPFYFELIHEFSETKFKFAAQNQEELTVWLHHLNKAAAAPEPPTATTPSKSSTATSIASMSQAMRTFILQSAGSSLLNGIGTDSPRGSPTKADQLTGATNASADPAAPRTRSVSSVSESASNTGSEQLPQFPVPLQSDQQRRYEFFSGQINFVKAITDVSEALRRIEPPQRKAQLRPRLEKLRIPAKAYIPLCKSTDPYCNVTSVCVGEGRVFTTHERAPCLIYFQTERDEHGHDVSKALFRHLYESCDSDGDADNSSPSTPPSPTGKPSSPFLRQLLQYPKRKEKLEKVFGELSFITDARLYKEANTTSTRWSVAPLIAKSYDDLRQEVLVMQLISYFHHIFQLEKLPLWLHPYRILSTGASTGLLEVVRNAMSLDGIKKTPGFKNLRHHFESIYEWNDVTNAVATSGEGVELLQRAEQNFIHSLAAYSIVCYILAIKDRHNGNILLDVEGHIVHIDFGFFLGRAPGGSFSFETAPFKLTAEMVDTLGGRHSDNFKYFSNMCVRGALAARKHAETIYTLVEVMSLHSKLPCFATNAAAALSGLRERLFLNMPEDKVEPTIIQMIERSYDHFGTNKYDQFQVYSNGIAK